MAKYKNHGFAGMDAHSFGFTNKGTILVNNVEYKYNRYTADQIVILEI
jgi:hypothetical protein